MIEFLKSIGFEIESYDTNFTAYFKDRHTGFEIHGRKLGKLYSFEATYKFLQGNLLYSKKISSYKDIQIEFLSDPFFEEMFPAMYSRMCLYRATKIQQHR